MPIVLTEVYFLSIRVSEDHKKVLIDKSCNYNTSLHITSSNNTQQLKCWKKDWRNILPFS